MTTDGPRESIGEFYTGRNVFMTGATGFMGKVLVEKLLRSIPGIGTLYCLVRPKRNKTVEERKEEFLSSMVFDWLRQDRPEALDKIAVIPGEITKPQLAISEEDMQLICEKVSVVFHMAATIKFDSPLKEAYAMNVTGLVHTIRVAKKMTHLASFVHVSTAYAYCNRSEIDEVVYPPKVSPEKIEGILEWMSEDQLNLLKPSLLDHLPNTYTYTKGLAEYVLLKEAADLPTAIMRPAIIGASLREPTPGWIDCLQGPTGLMNAVGTGMLRVVRVHPEGIADIVPVDLVDNMLIAVGWLTGIQKTSQLAIYHCTSGGVNPCTWLEMYHIIIPYLQRNPYQKIFRRIDCRQAKPSTLYPYWSFFYHVMPAYFADVFLWVTGREPRFVRLCRKLDKALGCLDYFMERTWTWSDRNSQRLRSLMSAEDQETFNFDVTRVKWQQYWEQFVDGVRTFLLKEDDSKQKLARQKYRRLRQIKYTFNLVMFLVASRIIYLRFETARIFWAKLTSFCMRMLASVGLNVPQLMVGN